MRPDDPPTNAAIAGQSGISVGAITADRNNSRACWFWLVADNLRLAAENAVAAALECSVKGTTTFYEVPGFMRYAVAAGLCFLASCGYHTAGPHRPAAEDGLATVGVPSFSNPTTRYKITDWLPDAIAKEFLATSRYRVANPDRADMVLKGGVLSYTSNAVLFDPKTALATSVEVHLILQVSLVERATGKVLFTRPRMEVVDNYEIPIQPAGAIFRRERQRRCSVSSRKAAQQIVSSILLITSEL